MSNAAISPNKRVVKKNLAVLVLAGFVILLPARFIHGDELVDHVPLFYQILWGAVGLGIGSYAVAKSLNGLTRRGWRGYVAMVVFTVLTVLLATYAGRLVYEAIGFAGVTPTETRVDAPIISTSSGKSGLHAIVAIGPTSREIWVRVTPKLYDRLDAHRYPGRDCLVLAIQSGRYGIKRAVLPGWLEQSVDTDRLKPCLSTNSREPKKIDRQ